MVKKSFLALLGIFALCRVSETTDVLFGYEDDTENKITDWDMEKDPSSSDWETSGATVARVSGGNTGRYSYSVTKRTNIDGGVKQEVTGLKSGTNYYASVFVKLTTNNPTKNGWSKFGLMCKIGGAKRLVARLPFQRSEWNKHWQQLGGDFKMSGSTAECWVSAEPLGATFLIDTFSLIEIKKHSDWKEHLDEQINIHRTNPLQITGTLPCSNAEVNVKLTRHEMGFGTAVTGRNFVGTSAAETKYRNFILKYFNWATFENDMKWKGMEKIKGQVSYGYATKGVKIMRDHNMTIRGHALLWDVMPTNPAWVQKETGSKLRADALKRIQGQMEHYKNIVEEWDVCNEELHQHFFEDATNYRELLIEEFKKAHSIDPKSLLFLNDYQITRDGQLTSAIADCAQMLKDEGAPCGGIGIQSHLRVLPIDAEVLEKRLQIACRLDMPCSITEFSVHSSNVNVRAAGLDMAFHVYFANPKVHVINLWGFADQFGNFAHDYYLTTGTSFTPTAAGKVLIYLLSKKWMIDETFTASGSLSKTIPNAFRGNYKLTVKCDGEEKVNKDFYVGKGTNTVSV